MKHSIPFLLLTLCLFSILSCKDPDTQLRKDLDASIFKQDMLQRELDSKQVPKSGDLIHMVFMNLKEDLTETQINKFIEEVNQLQGAPGVRSFTLGDFKNLKDDRAFSDYEMVATMAFDNEESYRVYQTDPHHLALKEKFKPYLDGAPGTYDFVKK